MNMAMDGIQTQTIQSETRTTSLRFVRYPITVQTLKPGHLGEDCPITKFYAKQKILNNVHKFEGCFLTGQASLIGLNVFNSCIVAP